jgi:hypothetical protein
MSQQNPVVRHILRAVRAVVVAFLAIPGAGLALVAYSCGEAPDREIAPPESSRPARDADAAVETPTGPAARPLATAPAVPPPISAADLGTATPALAAPPAPDRLPAPVPRDVPAAAAATPRPVSAPGAAPLGEPASAPPRVLSSALAADVTAREPAGVASAFTAGTDQVYAWFQLENAGPPTAVTVTWLRDGEARAEVSLEVGTSPRWRTWARRRLAPTDAGAWTAELRDPSGALLDTLHFTVSAPSPTIGLL